VNAAPDYREHARHHEYHPLSRAWLRGLIVEAMTGDIDAHAAQQLTAYFVWLRRVQWHADGDALSDWLEAAEMLNDTAEACELAVLPW
jgi:hypothetical protein